MTNICGARGCRMTAVSGENLCEDHTAALDRYGHPTEIRTKPDSLPDHLSPIWDELAPQVRVTIGLGGLEALCGQIYRLREAEKKVTEEGSVVADAKGNPVPHPAIKIERDAQGEVRKWLKDYGVR